MSLEYAREVLSTEAEAIRKLAAILDNSFLDAVELLISCKGKVVLTGMGKAGIIAQKISSTLASTGTPSLFLHPAEALHGDLGRIADSDVVIMLSNSGATREIADLIGPVKKIGARIIGITAGDESPLGRNCDVLLRLGDIEEACPLKLAPSASTTAMLALGDALALTVLNRRRESGKFGIENYAAFHPAGALGRSLMKVSEVMRTGESAPVVPEAASVLDVILAITKARAGAAVVVDDQGRMTGIFTDGDLRRYVQKEHNIRGDRIAQVMVRGPKSVEADTLVAEALRILKKHGIGELPVTDEAGKPLGVVNLKDITSFEAQQ
jgi:arabinose-5-phosphate isomerase